MASEANQTAQEVEASPAQGPRSGPEIIKDYVTRLPGKPGVYRMLTAGGDVLYVGKAKNLKARVSNYARLGGHTNRIAAMIAQTRAMEFTVTATETEALLLEANLIKRLKPRYNVILRDDKSFPYILLRRDHAAAQLVKHRGAQSRNGDYFGPFAGAGAVNRTINTLQKAFLVRTCSDSVYENRTRPCMLHQIKRCAAPCVGLVGLEEYAALVDEAADFLRGKSDQLRARLQKEMEAAAETLDFEAAGLLRDRIRALAPITTAQGVNPVGVEEADVVAVHMEGGVSCVHATFFRAGQNWGDRALFPRHDKDATPEDVLTAFLGQFYDDKPAPRLIMLSHTLENAELLAEALSLRADRAVTLTAPQRGEKAKLVAASVRNAQEALSRKLAESASQGRLLEGVRTLFDLGARPARIEVYDNSHIQGDKAVGAMIVADADGFAKAQYRTYTIKAADMAPGDDYAMMREVLTRRLSRLLKEREQARAAHAKDPGAVEEAAPRPAGWPDLILIDGGKGQLSAALEVYAAIGITPADVPIVGIAKGPDRNAGREQFFRPGAPPFQLPPNDPVLYYLQRLRDEAHRFAIGAHRAKRSRAVASNPLDEISGIGPTRKRALLAHFGSAKAVSRAALEDLLSVPGVSREMAQRIYDWFRA